MLVCVLSLIMGLNQPSWQWPIDPGLGLTSSFGEYRGARFHMGLDMSTGGVEGVPVHPAAPGTLVRVRADAGGYGLAVYVAHDRGFMTVYGHLAAFGPKLKAAIRAEGKDPASLFGSLALNARVEREDVLAWSGETGGGLPHLHFELRDGENKAVDPLAHSFPPLPVNQAQAVLTGYLLLPLDPESQINGRSLPHFASAEAGAVRATGRLGVLVSAHVPGLRGSRLGCRGVFLFQDDRQVGSWLPREIDYDHYHRGPLIHDQACSGFGPTTFFYCFDERSSYLDGLPAYRQESSVTVTGPTTLAVELMDITGKWRRFELALDPKAPLVEPETRLTLPTQPTTLALNAFDARLSATAIDVSGTLQSAAGLLGLAADQSVPIPLADGDAGEIVWRTDRGALKRTVGSLPRQASFTYTIGPWTLRGKDVGSLPPQALILEPADPKRLDGVLEYLSPVLRFGRDGLYLHGLKAEFDLAGVPQPQQVGLYAWSYVKNQWRHWGSLKAAGGVALDYFTPIVAARDLTPPVIRQPLTHPYFTGPRTVIPLADSGSGIDEDTIRITGREGSVVNGLFDFDRGWVILPADVRGPYSVTVSDKAGLTTRVTDLSP